MLFVSRLMAIITLAVSLSASAQQPPAQPPAAPQDLPEQATATADAGVVSLINGNSIAGQLRPSNSSAVITWQGNEFIEPLAILTDAIKSIRFPITKDRVDQQGQFAFESVSGDLVAGQLIAWDDQVIQIDSPLFGPLKLKSKTLRRMYRIEENPTLIFASLAGLQGWDAGGWDHTGWQEDGAQLWTDKPDTALNGDLGVPEKAMIEFKLSWTGEPNFLFAIGVDAAAKDDKRTDGWRIQSVGQHLVAIRENNDTADVTLVQSIAETKEMRLIAYLDQSKGSLQIYQPGGKSLASLMPSPVAEPDQPGDQPQLGSGIRVVNYGGNIRLESLRVSRWSGMLPTVETSGRVQLTLIDGSNVSGESIRLGEAGESLVVQSGSDDPTSVSIADLVAVHIARTGDAPAETEAWRPTVPSSLFLQDGSRVSGTTQSISETHWLMRSDEFVDPVPVPLELTRTFIVIKRDPLPADPNRAGRTGRLELGNLKLTGRLVPGVEQEAAGVSALRWQPFGCLGSSPLRIDASGRIVYREPPPKVTTPRRSTTERARQLQLLRLQQQQRGLDFGKLFLEKSDSKPVSRPVGADTHNMHVRSGDVIPCYVDSIDEAGVHITTELSADRTVPHQQIKALELVSGATPPDLKEAKKQRLLTLPRLQKSSPPTHLLCSRSGDFLRCRLIALGDQVVRIELHLEEMEIPRDRIAQIIWLHPEELLDQQDDEMPDQQVVSPFDRMAQVIKRDGKRVTFDPQQVDATRISGNNEVLGPCRFEIAEVDQLLFGTAIGDAVSELPYNQWALRPAIEPLMAQDLPGGSSTIGSESPLIGQPAPEIKLDLLGGDQFVLSECKGQVVVLDFWATWCAPCMQTMPLVDEAIAGFDPQQVRLVSVNLEEPAEHVRGVMERHEMHMDVALDIDGVAAQRYQARAIPQLVIVDREGKIVKLYVGGGSQVVEEMTAAIEEMLP